MANRVYAPMRKGSNVRIRQTGASKQRIAMRVPKNTRIAVKGNSRAKVV